MITDQHYNVQWHLRVCRPTNSMAHVSEWPCGHRMSSNGNFIVYGRNYEITISSLVGDNF